MPKLDRAIVVGMGEVGRRLESALEASGVSVDAVTRHEGWDVATDARIDAPRVLAMREHDLDDAFERFPIPLHSCLMLVQNGFLDVPLRGFGDAGRGLIWFTSKGDLFEVLQESLFFAGDASELAADLDAGGIPARALDSVDEFRVEMIVKGAWNCVVGLPLAVHDQPLGEYLDAHRDEWHAVVGETCEAAGPFYGVSVDTDAAIRRVEETTRKIRSVRGGAKALEFRNGAVARLGRKTGVATPVNDRLLRAVGFDPEGGD